MKIISVFFSMFLVFPIGYFLLHILPLYDSNEPFKAFGVSDKLIAQIAMPSIVLLGVYTSGFLFSIFLNIRKKYITNIVFLSIMIVFYLIIIIFRLI